MNRLMLLFLVVLTTTGCVDVARLGAGVVIGATKVAKGADKETVRLTSNVDDVRYCLRLGDVSALTHEGVFQDARRFLGYAPDLLLGVPIRGTVFVDFEQWSTASGPYHGQVHRCPDDMGPGATRVTDNYLVSKSKKREGSTFPLRIVRRASEPQIANCVGLGDVTDDDKYDLVKKVHTLGGDTVVEVMVDGQSVLTKPPPRGWHWGLPQMTVKAYRCKSNGDEKTEPAPQPVAAIAVAPVALRTWLPGNWIGSGGGYEVTISSNLTWEYTSTVGGRWFAMGTAHIKDPDTVVLEGWFRGSPSYGPAEYLTMILHRYGESLTGEFRLSRTWHVTFSRAGRPATK